MGKATAYCKKCGFTFEARECDGIGKLAGKALAGGAVGFAVGGPIGGLTGLALGGVSSVLSDRLTCPKCGELVDRPQ